MIEDTPKSQPVFNAVSPPAAHPGHVSALSDTAKSNAVALVIDIQSFDGMKREDALAYSKALAQQLTEFRQAGIAPVWVAIAPGGSKLLEPAEGTIPGDAPVRDLLVLEEMGFTGHQSEFSNHDIYAAFINDFGPRENEAVYRKPSMSALATPDDHHDKDRILEQAGIKLESRKADEDHPETKYIQPGQQDAELAKFFPGSKNLQDYLADKKTTDAFVLGTVSKYCVAETSISAAAKGYNTHVLSGLVLSWTYPVTGSTRDNGQLVWSGFDHKALIKNAVADALNDSTRSFSADQKNRIEAITMTDRHSIPKMTVSNAPLFRRGAEA